MIFNLVDKGLNESIGLGIEARIAGFGDGMAGVLGFPIGRALQKAAVERDIARFGDIALASASSAGVPIRFRANISLFFEMPSLTSA